MLSWAYSLLLLSLLGSLNWGGLGSSGWGSSLGSLLGIHSSVDLSFSLSLLLLQELGEELLVGNVSLLAGLPVILLLLLVLNLSSDSLLSDESLDLWGFVESLITRLDFSSNNILGDIVLLSKSEGSSDGVGSLWSKSSWSLGVGETWELSLTLLDDLEGNNGEIWAADATSD